MDCKNKNVNYAGRPISENDIEGKLVNPFEQDEGFLEKLSMALAANGFRIIGAEGDHLIAEEIKTQ